MTIVETSPVTEEEFYFAFSCCRYVFVMNMLKCINMLLYFGIHYGKKMAPHAMALWQRFAGLLAQSIITLYVKLNILVIHPII